MAKLLLEQICYVYFVTFLDRRQQKSPIIGELIERVDQARKRR